MSIEKIKQDFDKLSDTAKCQLFLGLKHILRNTTFFRISDNVLTVHCAVCGQSVFLKNSENIQVCVNCLSSETFDVYEKNG